MQRRSFLRRTGLALGAGAVLPSLSFTSPSNVSLDSWANVRSQFLLDPKRIHMAQMFLASHPKPVRDAIDHHRKMFDESPVEYWEHNWKTMEPEMCKAAANYIQADPTEVALTDSTTMGLGLLYTGFQLKEGDDILSTTHDHYATDKSLEYAAAKNKATIRRVTLYKEASNATADEMVGTLTKAIQPNTKLVAVTWVHSVSGMKLPIRTIADAIKSINSNRSDQDRIYFCVDGVHGFGVEDVTMADLGCDFFAASTHKWIFGPRGTGILWGRKDAWNKVVPTIPAFSYPAYGMWLGMIPQGKLNFCDLHSPGGFHSFENRWALKEAFDFHMQIGKKKVADRTHQLGSMLKEGLRGVNHIKLHTPVSTELSSGINCFEVEGMTSEEAIKKLSTKKIIGSAAPYPISYARLTPSIINNEEEVKMCIAALEKIKE
ncbi:MAG: aminotransferase class V-fold PLP-dependent enzyme [Bacteroidetes bacterium]|nr:aminotransferase class V-fold PLP-dependent enzyme [Bacteroidota bacterium]